LFRRSIENRGGNVNVKGRWGAWERLNADLALPKTAKTSSEGSPPLEKDPS